MLCGSTTAIFEFVVFVSDSHVSDQFKMLQLSSVGRKCFMGNNSYYCIFTFQIAVVKMHTTIDTDTCCCEMKSTCTAARLDNLVNL